MRVVYTITKDEAEELAWILCEDFETVFPMSPAGRKELEERFTYILLNYCHICKRIYCSCNPQRLDE